MSNVVYLPAKDHKVEKDKLTKLVLTVEKQAAFVLKTEKQLVLLRKELIANAEKANAAISEFIDRFGINAIPNNLPIAIDGEEFKVCLIQ